MERRAVRLVGDRCVIVGISVLVVAHAISQGVPAWVLFPIGLLIVLSGHWMGKVENMDDK